MIHREQLIEIQKYADKRVIEYADFVKDTREMSLKLRTSLKELASKVSHALALKADQTAVDKSVNDLKQTIAASSLDSTAGINVALQAWHVSLFLSHY